MEIAKLGYEDVVAKIIKQMMENNREKKEVKFFPFTPNPAFDQAWPCFDFSKVFGKFNEGDIAYLATDLIVPIEGEMVISVSGNSQISFNGELVQGEPRSWNMPDGKGDVICHKVVFKKGMNRLIVKHTASKNFFGFYMYVAKPSTPLGWMARPTIPHPEFYEQEGFIWSRIYNSNEKTPEPFMDKIDWIIPEITEKKVSFDFNKLTKQNVASGITWASGEVEISHKCPICIYANGNEIYSADKGCFKSELAENTILVVEASKNENGFGFTVEKGEFKVDFYKTHDKSLTWLWIEGVYNISQNLQFKEPYIREDGEKTFFKFYRKNTFLRPYMDTVFFAYWFYPIMVTHYGLLKAAERFNLQEYIDYFKESIGIISDYYEYMQFDNEKFGCPPFMRESVNLDALDPIGTIGMNAAELFLMTGSKSAYSLCQSLNKALDTVPKTNDGIFYRKDTFWADDVYMSVPFLARMGKITEDYKYFDEAVKQLKGFYNRLYMEDEKLFSHIYLVKEKAQTRIPWGRGNGWVMLALSELLLYMPENYDKFNDVLKIYQEFAEGILNYQDKDGMWHQVVDELESYAETSATGMFIIALARGVKNGWINENIAENVKKGWKHLLENYVDDDGNILNVCAGSRFSISRGYYRELKSVTNDNHGIGIVLLATTEVADM